MTTIQIINLIITASLNSGLDPSLMLAIAEVESKLNPNAVGSVGEIGLYQVRPEYSLYTKSELFGVRKNITEGFRKVLEARLMCKHQVDSTWLVCYNAGATGGSKIKKPREFPYYKKVMAARKAIKKELQLARPLDKRLYFAMEGY